MAASVLRPTRLARRRAEWRLSAEGHRLDSIGADSQARQIVSNRYRPLIAKREVVFRCPALVAMSVDADLCLRPFRQPLRVSLEHLAGIVAQDVLVVVEENIVERLRRVELLQRHALEQL